MYVRVVGCAYTFRGLLNRKMSSHKIESWDVSPKTKEIMEWRHKRRLQLREEYLRECLNPTKQKLLVDSAVDRFANMRNLHEYRLKIDAKGVGLYFAITFGAIAGLSLALQKLKGDSEHKIRTGQIPYADRESKFA